jgi:putative transposase
MNILFLCVANAAHSQMAEGLARKILRKFLKKQGFAPKRITTDKLKSYAVAICKERLSVVHDQGLRTNNRAEKSHLPTRRRERKQQRFKSPGSAQRFLSIHIAVYYAFFVQRHLLQRRFFKQFRAEAFSVWQQSWRAA